MRHRTEIPTAGLCDHFNCLWSCNLAISNTLTPRERALVRFAEADGIASAIGQAGLRATSYARSAATGYSCSTSNVPQQQNIRQGDIAASGGCGNDLQFLVPYNFFVRKGVAVTGAPVVLFIMGPRIC